MGNDPSKEREENIKDEKMRELTLEEPEKAAKALVRDQKAAGKRSARQPGGLSAVRRKEAEFVSAKRSTEPAPRALYDY